MIEKRTNRQEQLDKIVESKIKGMGLDALFHLVDVGKKREGAGARGSYDKTGRNRFAQKLGSGIRFLGPQNLKTRLRHIYSCRPNFILGVSLSSTSIKIVELRDVKGTVRINRARFFPIPHSIGSSHEKSEGFIIDTVKESLDHQTTKNAYICSVIPRNKVVIKFLSLPTVDPVEIEKMIALEAEHLVPFPLNECIFDYGVLSRGENRSRLIFVMVKKDEIHKHLHLLGKAALRPSAVDVSSLVLHNTLLREKSLQGTIVHIYIGPDHTDLNVAEDGLLKTSRGIAWGSGTLTSGLAKKLNVNLEIAEKMQRENGIVIKKTFKNDIADSISESACAWAAKLVTEINETVRHFQFQEGSGVIDKIILTGEGSRLLNLDEYVKDHTGTKVFIQEPPKEFDQAGTDGSFQKFYSELGLLTGLAGRFRPEQSAGVNLLPGDLRFSYERRKKGVQRLITACIAGTVLLMCVTLPAGIIGSRSRYIRRLEGIIAELKPSVTSVQNLKEKVKTIEDYQSISRSCLEILREINMLVSLDVLINRFSFEQNESVILIGEAGSHSSVVDLSRAVRESKLFDDAKLVYTKKRNRLEDRVDFEIICKLSQ